MKPLYDAWLTEEVARADAASSTPQELEEEIQLARDYKAGKLDTSDGATPTKFVTNMIIVELAPPQNGRPRQLAIFNGVPLDDRLKQDLHELGEVTAAVSQVLNHWLHIPEIIAEW
jgi:hypothetical protein